MIGSGNNGVVWKTTRRTALKIQRKDDTYKRELVAYQRLAGCKVVAGFAVPVLLDFDDELLAIEMTIVRPPFILDFASAYPVGAAPEFEGNWRRVAAVIRAFERDFGLVLLDVHTRNIWFE